MLRKSVLKGAGLGVIMAAAVAVSGSAAAAFLAFELKINDPIFNSQGGNENAPDFQLTNTSGMGSTAQITDFLLTIGDTDFNFDFVRSESVVIDTAAGLTFTLNEPDRINDANGSDQLDYDFDGFDPGDVFQFETDIDADAGTVVQDYRSILFPEGSIFVTFDNSETLRIDLTDIPGDDEVAFTFSARSQVAVSEPGTLALLGAFLIGGAALRRRSAK